MEKNESPKNEGESTTQNSLNAAKLDAIIDTLEKQVDRALKRGYYGKIAIEITVQDGFIKDFVEREEVKHSRV